MNYNERKIENNQIVKHNIESIPNYFFNLNKVKSIIKYCEINQIEVFLIKTPMHRLHRDNYVQNKKRRWELALDSLGNNYSIRILDFENDDRFITADFKNQDHLNPDGAEKLSRFLDYELNKMIK